MTQAISFVPRLLLAVAITIGALLLGLALGALGALLGGGW